MSFGRLGTLGKGFGKLGAAIKAGVGGGGGPPPAASPTYHILGF